MNFMTVLRKINSWVHKHWSVIRHRPDNGEHAVQDIEPILEEMRNGNKRVCKVVEKMVEDTATVQRMIADGTISNDNRT